MPVERDVKDIVQALVSQEGPYTVERPFPTNRLAQVDPFIMFDHMCPVTFKPDEAVGAPLHPHRGFEAVTVMLQGELEHRDSMGNKGLLRAGDVQRLTAGSGVVHDEGPSPNMKRLGGTIESFQIWVNLPQRFKLADPAYQDVPKEKIPVIIMNKFIVRVIAGEAFGQKAVVNTKVPIQLLDVHMESGAEFKHNIPPEMNAFVFVYRGEGRFGKSHQPGKSGQALILDTTGAASFTAVANTESNLKFLLLAGQPINEPIARYGPFVMNTYDEIEKAFADHAAGKMVLVKPKFEMETNRQHDYDPTNKDSSIV